MVYFDASQGKGCLTLQTLWMQKRNERHWLTPPLGCAATVEVRGEWRKERTERAVKMLTRYIHSIHAKQVTVREIPYKYVIRERTFCLQFQLH